MGFEPTVFGTTIRRFNQLSYTHHVNINEALHHIVNIKESFGMARLAGFEPAAYCLEGSYSIQLS